MDAARNACGIAVVRTGCEVAARTSCEFAAFARASEKGGIVEDDKELVE